MRDDILVEDDENSSMREELELTKAIKTRPSCSPRSSRSRARRPPVAMRGDRRGAHCRLVGCLNWVADVKMPTSFSALHSVLNTRARQVDAVLESFSANAQLAVLHKAVNGDDPDSTSAGRLSNTSAAPTNVFECVHAHVVQCCRGMHLMNFTQLQLLYANELEEIVAQSPTAQAMPLPAIPRCSAAAA
ncbi:hypothetical protein PF005_g30515 [Phytophthora fragariae]|uniref:Uncharacterized protein n=1 Tax=Phytophthora fragariae TaxID=53985 RepID=A0A6A3GZI8_9STRA|nr:hypothetical protein PF009_g30750 [Phytophthora fragariae]KAE8962252.1 hypothetical protein PF011_g29458 [Phytophthora fragariae]KAE9066383.1 hypothetical protein PF006_g30254 [Phytophthora fragariae]KAE9163271.1 hypothetical protein PF005_g30515 [Phytophthora fragariae]KAE9168354.1 hypothetical protein PF004_g28529 [Phytophthora fragariae]